MYTLVSYVFYIEDDLCIYIYEFTPIGFQSIIISDILDPSLVRVKVLPIIDSTRNLLRILELSCHPQSSLLLDPYVVFRVPFTSPNWLSSNKLLHVIFYEPLLSTLN